MKAIPFAILGAFLALLLALYALPQQTGAQGNTPCYGSQGGAEMVAGNGCTYTFEAGSRQKNQSNSLTVTNGEVISNVYGVQRISMTSAATVTLATTTTYVTGDTLIFYNASPSGTLTIADSDPVKASGAIALGQYDTASLWYDGTYWIQTGESDN